MKLALPVWLTEPAQITDDSGYLEYKYNRNHHTCVRTIIYQHNEHVGLKGYFSFLSLNALYSQV